MFGFLACFFIFVAALFWDKHPLVSATMGGLTILSICISAFNWRLALIDSGKNTFLLGFYRYPYALIICIILFLAGVLFLAQGIMTYKNASKK